MPQKLNSSGKMQNYVPAGNGDASGEYGDNATGSNIHYKSEDIIANIKKVFEEKTNVKGRNGNYDYVKNHSTYKGQTLKALNGILENADEESVKLLNNAYGKNNYKFSIGRGCFYNYERELLCDRDDFTGKKDYGVAGRTWFHENGHLLDFLEGGNYPKSYTYKNKDGKSLNDIVKEEIKTLPIEELKKYKDVVKEKILEENGYTLEEFEQMKQAYLNDPKQIESGKLYEESWDKVGEERIALRERSRLLIEECQRNHSEYINLSATIGSQQKNRYLTMITAISDAYSSIHDFGFGTGHSLRYYKGRDYGVGAEFFANTFSDKTVNKEAYEFTRKYMPKSIVMFEELMEEFKK